jgi:CrcB protein
MKLLLLVSAGGAIGAALRFMTYQFFAAALARGLMPFPWGTLTVNILGSFLMGLAVVIIGERLGGSPEARAFFMTGILGGYTTFSAFSLDAMELYLNRSPELVAAYVLGSVTVSIAALLAGFWIARWLLT